MLVGNVGEVIGGIAAFPDARPDDGRLEIGVVTAEGSWQWARVLGTTAVGHTASLAVRADHHRGEDRRRAATPRCRTSSTAATATKTQRLKFRVKPAAITVCVPERDER